MEWLIQKIKKAFTRHNASQLPEEGSVYVHNKKGSAYNGMSGVVYHHDCKTRFMIFTGNSWLCCIKND